MSSPVRASRLRFEHHPTGLGVDKPSPRLSWIVEPCDDSNVPKSWTQRSYEVEIQRNNKTSSYSISSPNTVLVPWPADPLRSQEQAHVRVRSHCEGDSTAWSTWATVEASLIDSTDLTGNYITLKRADKRHPEENGNRPLVFRKSFSLRSPHAKSRLYITALGLYEAHINGVRVGDECLAPGWTSYQHRICFQTFDVGGHLRKGDNEIRIEVAEGWYSGRLRWGEGESNFYGDCLAAFAQLDLFDAESSMVKSRIQTNDTWQASVSSIIASGIYDGETYELGGTSGSESGTWVAASVIDRPPGALVPSVCAPVKVTEVIKPTDITVDPDGKCLVDFGQNLVGRIRIPALSKPDGTRVVVKYAEVLEDNRLNTRPLRAAKVTDTIIFGGGRALKNWYPRFTYHGFRYIEISGWHVDDDIEPLTMSSLVAEVMHTDMLRTGHFRCSNELLNKLHENTVWSMRGNFVSIPTDCPQRDERLGWTGDIQVFSPTASFLFDSGGMLSNWMRDLLDEQKQDGGIVPLVVPNAMRTGPWPTVPQAVWDDVVILLPWTLYLNFGDMQVLKDGWQGMKDYLNTITRDDDGLWGQDLWQLGDWLDPNAPPSDPGLARTDGVLVADAYLVHVTSLMSDIAGVLKHSVDSDRFAKDAAKLKAAFHDKYMARSGLVVGDSQTSLALSIVFGIHHDQDKLQNAASRLARLVRFAKFRVSTGFAGTPVVLDALTKGGHPQIAYRMLLEEECPSWLYPVRQGATTIWERWDSMLEDGSTNPGEMTSFNHYALGSVANWMHNVIGGVSPVEPGWKQFRFAPVPGGDITNASIRFQSPNGNIEADWELRDGVRLESRLLVPPNTTAIVEGGSRGPFTLGSGEHKLAWDVEKDDSWPPKPLLTQFQDFET